jgi:endothelin-converting enzyme
VDPLATYNPQPLDNLTRYMTYMDFPDYVSTFTPRNFPERVVVTYPPYAQDLLRLIEETSPEVIQVSVSIPCSGCPRLFVVLSPRPTL